MHHFFVTPDNVNIEDKKIVITGSDVNHIKNVLRMKIGEELLISDGAGQDYMCEVEEFTDSSEVIAKINETEFSGTELSSKIFLFQGLPKSDKMELIIQKAVELGVFEIIPVATKRAIVKLDKKKEQSKINRWNEISKSAAKQSRRSIIPKVCNVMSFKEAIEYAKTLDINLIPYENYKDMQETKTVINEITKDQNIGIFIGPEGGFADEEVELAVNNNVKRISLGKRILRTETAGLMIISVLMYKLED
ncbi:MAG: 16S rRNA (uracil(1498)-N(3))-methyltransferase [Lachnospiraceae bacterium]|nr:16S rRNA (uracil(1498)-N(3))-methyltransferase [Lachnospiraceae bacterium]